MAASILIASIILLGGIVILAITHILIKLIIEPLADFRKIKGRIHTALLYHANVYMNPIHFYNEYKHKDQANWVSKDLRSLASELMAAYQMLSCRNFLVWLRVVPERQEIEEAGRHLIRLSNGIYTFSTYTYAKYKHDDRKANDYSARELARILDLYLR